VKRTRGGGEGIEAARHVAAETETESDRQQDRQTDSQQCGVYAATLSDARPRQASLYSARSVLPVRSPTDRRLLIAAQTARRPQLQGTQGMRGTRWEEGG